MAAAAPSLDDRLRSLLASDPAAMAAAPALWAEVAAQPGPYRLDQALLVTRYDDAKRVLRDLEHFGYVHVGQGRGVEEIVAGFSPAGVEAFHEVAAFERNYMNRSGDGETHARLRRIAHRAFTPRRIEEMRAVVARYADDLLDGVAGEDTADLAPFAYTLPLMLICDMLGVPEADRDLVHSWSGRLGRNRGGVEEEPLLDAREAMREFRAYVHEMLDAHRSASTPLPPLVESLVGAGHEERLTELELTAMFVILLFAGHETTTNLLGIGLTELLRAPAEWRRLGADLSLAGQAAEELLRYVSPVQFLGRAARRDTVLGGLDVAEGQYVMPVLAAANRDPALFPGGEHLDLGRPNAKEHLSLGFGIHFCLGAALARLEGEVGFAALARRLPDLELAVEPDGLVYTGHSMLRRLAAIPVAPGRDRGRAAA